MPAVGLLEGLYLPAGDALEVSTSNHQLLQMGKTIGKHI